MKIEFTKKFDKQLLRNENQIVLDYIKNVVENVIEASNIDEISNLKKMKGEENAYRIRKGKYRIGIFIEGDTVLFSVFYLRKDIYRFFPLF